MILPALGSESNSEIGSISLSRLPFCSSISIILKQCVAMYQPSSEGRDDSEKSNFPPFNEKGFLGELWEFIWLPLVFAGIAFGISWAIWYGTTEPCTEGLAERTNCSLSTLAQYVNLDALTKMFANAAIAGGAGTVWSYIMFTRERREREALQRRLDAVQRQADEERRRAEEERKRADEERRQASEELRQANATIQRLTEQVLSLTEAAGNGNQTNSG